MSAFERAREAIRHFRSLPLDQDASAAAVAADACEEAGLYADAAWYRIAADLQPVDVHPKGDSVFFGRDFTLLDVTVPPSSTGEETKR